MAAGLGKLRCSVADKVAGYFAGAGVEAAGVLVGVSIGVVVRFRFGFVSCVAAACLSEGEGFEHIPQRLLLVMLAQVLGKVSLCSKELVCSVLGVGSCWISKLVVIIRGLRGAGCSSLTKDRCSSRENISLVPPLLDCCGPSPSSSFPKLGCVRAYWRSKEQLVQLWLGECSHELDRVHRER
ncbi:hypothetical protein Drorol1_Dr00017928 [Drosera rotundifolia]